MFKRLWRKFGPNPLDVILKQAACAQKKNVLVAWNRGLGDIPLGLFALTYRIRQYLPEAKITFMTRKDLEEGFKLLHDVHTIVCSDWKRGVPFDMSLSLERQGLKREDFDLILEKPDPTHWLSWQLGKLIPKLEWNSEWDPLEASFLLPQNKCYVGVHVQTETVYSYEKNWPIATWTKLFEVLTREKDIHVILFGFEPKPIFSMEKIIDLRGKTTLFEMISIIKNRCSFLVVPDSGVLSMIYYLNVNFPLKVVSLWADPKQGVLRQKVKSPNPRLVHIPLKGAKEDIRNISVDAVLEALFSSCSATEIEP